MSEAVERIRLAFAGDGENAEPYLVEGWSRAESAHRWTEGPHSVVRLPPIQASRWFALTLLGSELNLGAGTPAQRVTLSLNGARLRTLRLVGGMPMAIAFPGDLLREDAHNLLILDHPGAARPSEIQPGNRDTRRLSLAMQRIEIEPLDVPLSLAPQTLPPAPTPEEGDARRSLAETFQSLGQSCDVGNFQRQSGAEPFGLLRFAGIFPLDLLKGLRTRFAGVGDVDKLSFFTHEDSRELQGKHAIYGLNYHTFKMVDETDVADLVVKEAKRLNYLARLFFEQLENDEKIFLRAEHFETPEEALALHLALRAYHPRARLLLLNPAPANAPERVGRVLELRSGLYRGYLSRMSDPARDPIRPLMDEWTQLCATVVAYERARGRV